MKKSDLKFVFHDDPSVAENPTDEQLLSESKNTEYKMNVEMVPPDGGWGWIVLLGCLISNVLGSLPLYVFSVLFYPMFVSHGTSTTKISWIFNLTSSMWSLLVLLLGPLSQEFGFRKVAIFGGVANFVSLFLSAFVQNPNYLFITFVLPAGISGCTGSNLSLLICSTYFKKRKGFALGVTTIGNCLCFFLSPIVANYLSGNYGFMGASLILSAICLNRCVAGSLYQPVEWHMKSVQTSLKEKILMMNENPRDCEESESENKVETYEKNLSIELISRKTNSKHSSPSRHNLNEQKNDAEISKLVNTKSKSKFRKIFKSTYNNLKSMKYLRVHLISYSFCVVLLGYLNFYMLVPFVVTNLGYTLEISAWCSSVASVGDISGRIVISLLADRKFFNVKYAYNSGFCLIGLSFIAFSFARSIKALMTLSCCWGISAGFSFALYPTYMIEIMGVKMMPAVMGISSFANIIGSLTLGPLIGIVRDKTESYMYVLWMLGGIELLMFCILFLMPYAEKFDNRKYSESNERKKFQEQ